MCYYHPTHISRSISKTQGEHCAGFHKISNLGNLLSGYQNVLPQCDRKLSLFSDQFIFVVYFKLERSLHLFYLMRNNYVIIFCQAAKFCSIRLDL